MIRQPSTVEYAAVTKPSETPTRPADGAEQQRLGQELESDVAAGRADRAPEPDLAAPLDPPITITLAIPIPPTTSATRPQTQEERGERSLGRGLRFEHIRWPGHLDLLGVLRVDGGRQGCHEVATTAPSAVRRYIVVVSRSSSRYASAATRGTRTDRLMSSASGNGSITPTTWTGRSPMKTTCGSPTSLIPNRSTATEPSTATG